MLQGRNSGRLDGATRRCATPATAAAFTAYSELPAGAWHPPERDPQAGPGQAPAGTGTSGACAESGPESSRPRQLIQKSGSLSRGLGARLGGPRGLPGTPRQGVSGPAFLRAGGLLATLAAVSAWVVTRPRPAVHRAQSNFFQQPLMVITVIGAAIYPLSNYDTQKKPPRTPCRGMLKTVSQLNRNPICLVLNF